jgi:isochorismatase family protein
MTTALAPSYDRLTRDNAVVLLIDPQVGPLWELDASALRRQITGLARVARQLGIPTIVTTLAPDELGPVIPELPGSARTRAFIERRVGNAWDDARVRHDVRATRRTRLIIAGSVTDVGVAPCAVAAAKDGYLVHAAIESKPATHNAVRRMIEAGVIVTSYGIVNLELTGADARPSALQLYR